ncbi:hypothetical protein ACIHFD_59215 [Nonomuraea sp. NPDC051941]
MEDAHQAADALETAVNGVTPHERRADQAMAALRDKAAQEA